MRDTRAREIRDALTDPVGVARLLSLAAVRRSGQRGILVCCPIHDDRRASLSLRIGPRDGRLAVKCHAASCALAGDVLSLIGALHGLDTRRVDDFKRILEIGIGLLGGVPPPPPRRHQRPSSVHAPSPSTLRRVLAKCSPCAEDATVATWLRGRGLDAAAIDASAAAYALDPTAKGVPSLAASWPRSGHRLIVPAYDRRGEIASLRARLVSGEHPAKSLAPRSAPTEGAVLANAAGLALLRGDAGAPEVAAVLEGEPDLLSVPQEEIAAFGLVAGNSWTPELGRALWGRDVVVATHDDPAGDALAATVTRTITGRAVVRDPYARGREQRQRGSRHKGRFDINDLVLDGQDVTSWLREADVVLDETAPKAPEPAEVASAGQEGQEEPGEAPSAVQRAIAGALAASAGREWLHLNERDLAVLRVLIRRAWWRPEAGPDGVLPGESFPAIDTIARDANMAAETVRLALRELERWRALTRKRRVTDDRGRDMTYLYRLTDPLIRAGMSCRKR